MIPSLTLVVAVYERKDELLELLKSLEVQTDLDFQVIVVDDGSVVPLENLLPSFEEKLDIQFFHTENKGAAKARNFGVECSKTEYCIFIDSDCELPENYISIVKDFLKQNPVDCFGGPDAASEQYSIVQKAISYSMTSFLTTGGIRGASEKVGKFQPRSFNMGIKKEVYQKVGGFSDLKIGEDIELSLRLWKNGFTTALIPAAKVYHKRRTSIVDFSKRIYRFGKMRPTLFKMYPEYKKITFYFPSFFLNPIFLIPLMVYALLIFSDVFLKKGGLSQAVLAILTSFVQHFSYGWGFMVGSLTVKNKKD